MRPRLSLRTETVLFIVVTLSIMFLFQLPNLLGSENTHVWNRLSMVTPGIVGFALSWLVRRELPNAVRFSFTGWRPYLAAFVFPPAVQCISRGLAYTCRKLSSQKEFITYTPKNLNASYYQPFHGGLSLVGIILAIAIAAAPWILIAFAYAWRWPERLSVKLPRPVALLCVGLLWVPLFWINDVSLNRIQFRLPGELGEELGWRGYIVRKWLHRPLMAAAVSMPLWGMAHLPVIMLPAQRGRVFQNICFLAAIAMFGAVMLKLYRWSQSIWPCAFLHLWWNLSNETVLGDVYGWEPGLFSGRFWIFNGEGLFGLLIMTPIAAWILWQMQ